MMLKKRIKRIKRMIIQKMIFLSVISSLIGCTPEANYRGVPGPTWQHLSAEQKQLIVDRAYQDEMHKVE